MELIFTPTLDHLIQPKPDLRYAVSVLHVLNIQAKYMRRTPRRRLIFRMKELYIQHLSENGMCLYVSREDQQVRCTAYIHNSPYGYKCKDCGGTGYLPKNSFYIYTFQVEGLIFSWHQPVGHEVIPPRLTTTEKPVTTPNYMKVTETDEDDLLYIAWSYLVLSGYRGLSLAILPSERNDCGSRPQVEKRYEATV